MSNFGKIIDDSLSKIEEYIRVLDGLVSEYLKYKGVAYQSGFSENRIKTSKDVIKMCYYSNIGIKELRDLMIGK